MIFRVAAAPICEIMRILVGDTMSYKLNKNEHESIDR